MTDLQSHPKSLAASIKQLASGKGKENKRFFQSLRTIKGNELDAAFHQAHEEVFAHTNCLECANCCHGTGPLFLQKDIERLAKHFRIRPGQFVEKYLREDEEGDMVLKATPCPFLATDNRCTVYEVRPKACREFPHTDRRNMGEILELTRKNIAVCPAVYEIVERIKVSLKK